MRKQADLFLPAGYISSREAVIRLAEARHPAAEVRAYLLPASGPSSLLSEATAFHPKWLAAFASDAFKWPSQGKSDASAWLALKNGRIELRQALGDGALTFYEETSEREPSLIGRYFWRKFEGFEALLSGVIADAGAVVLAREAAFSSWLAGGAQAPRLKATSPAAIEKWMHAHVMAHPRIKRLQAVKDCQQDTGATGRAAVKGWEALPETMRGKPGHRK